MSNVTTAELSAVAALSNDIQRALKLASSEMATLKITESEHAELQFKARCNRYEELERAYYEQAPRIQPTADFESLNLATAYQQHHLCSSDLLPFITSNNRAVFTDTAGNLNLATHSYPSTPPRLHTSRPSATSEYAFPRPLTADELNTEIARRRATRPKRDPRRQYTPAVDAFPLYDGREFRAPPRHAKPQKKHKTTNAPAEETCWEQALLDSTAAPYAALVSRPGSPSTTAAATALETVRAKATAHMSARRARGAPPEPEPCFFCFHECRFWERRGMCMVELPCPCASNAECEILRRQGRFYKGVRPYKYYRFGIMPLSGKMGNFGDVRRGGEGGSRRRGQGGQADGDGDSLMSGMD